MSLSEQLIALCEANKYVWHRKNPDTVRQAFAQMGLDESCQFSMFLQRYDMQFFSKKIDYELTDILYEDGVIADVVDYAHSELEIDKKYLPLSVYHVESIYLVDTEDNSVVYATWDDELHKWNYELVSESFFEYMIDILS